jgi:hypothetical protein
MNDRIFDDLKLNEFSKKDPYDINERIGNLFSDELVIRKAKIHKIMGPGDDRLQVQPMPEFMKIPSEEKDNLPIYPMFIKGTMITGNSVSDDKSPITSVTQSSSEEEHEVDCVWCLCTRDFSVGYVLGQANLFGSGIKDEVYEDSYSWEDVRTFLAQRQALPEDFDYKNLIVTTFFATDQGGMIDCYNRKTGDWVHLNTTGAIITVQQKQIYMRVGSPPNPVSSGPVGFSMIKMTGDKIHMKAPNIELEANDLVLGHHALNLGALLTQGPVIGRNGVAVVPISNIHV